MNNEILSTEQVLLDLSLNSQEEVFNEIAKKALELGFIKKEKKLIKSFKHRESESTTGFGDGFAIPHARDKVVLKTGIFIVRLTQGVEWKALDDQPVKLAIALIVPKDKAADQHLELLSKVAVKLTQEAVQKILLTFNDKETIIKEILK